MTRPAPRRTTLLVAGLVLAFVAPMSAAYALWSISATASLGVSVQEVYYLENPGPGNSASHTHLDLGTKAPNRATLPNYDTDRDSAAGLLLAKGSGLGDTDDTKNQRWSVKGPIAINGPVTLRLWSAMKGFDTTKSGSVVAGLYQCNDNPNFGSCTLLGSATVTSSGSWSGGSSTWVPKDFSFGTLDLDVPANRRLYLKIAVNSSSGDDMWFAYDTAAQPSGLRFG